MSLDPKKLFPSETVLLTEHFDAHQDWINPIVGFFIVASKDATKRSISDFTNEELAELSVVMKKIRIAQREVLGIQDVYIFQNEDTDHGFHMWMFPRHAWMEEFGRKVGSVKAIIDHAAANRISDADLQEVRDAVAKVRVYLEQQN